MSLYRGMSTIDFSAGTRDVGIYPSINVLNVTASHMLTNKIPYSPGSNTLLLTDIALVERNILNHLFTPLGSRIMMPTFGTTISKLIFEPLDFILVAELYTEIERVIKYDPRVSLLNLTVTPSYDANMVNVQASLKYLQLNVVKDTIFNLQFNQ